MTHKYASVIKAWADGARVSGIYGTRRMVVDNPNWSEDRAWEVEPPNQRRQYDVSVFDGGEYVSCGTLNPNLRLTFQGDKLVSAEVLV